VAALAAVVVTGLAALVLPALRRAGPATMTSTAVEGNPSAAGPAATPLPASTAGLAKPDAAPPSTPPATGGPAVAGTADVASDRPASTATSATEGTPRPPSSRPAPNTAGGAATGASPATVAAPASPARPAPVLVTALVRPYAARALLDGVEVARGEQRVVFRIGPGAHRIRVEHPCCEPFERSVDASAPGFQAELKVPLSPRPALLRVTGDPGTAIWLSGRLLGTAGDSQREPLRIPVPGDGENPYEGVLDLRLEPPGRPAVDVPVRVRAGQEIVVPVMGAEGGSP
jgi:serine/threonine-protein kinase